MKDTLDSKPKNEPLNEMGMLAEFHEHCGAPKPEKLRSEESIYIEDVAELVHGQSRAMLQFSRELTNHQFEQRANRAFRVHLMLEELAEVILALANGDEVELADGLADLLYVTYGTALSFDIPIHHVFREVHRSNMTKRPGASTEAGLGGDRVGTGDKGKGPDFTPPDIKGAIKEGREAR